MLDARRCVGCEAAAATGGIERVERARARGGLPDLNPAGRSGFKEAKAAARAARGVGPLDGLAWVGSALGVAHASVFIRSPVRLGPHGATGSASWEGLHQPEPIMAPN